MAAPHRAAFPFDNIPDTTAKCISQNVVVPVPAIPPVVHIVTRMNPGNAGKPKTATHEIRNVNTRRFTYRIFLRDKLDENHVRKMNGWKDDERW